MRSDGVPDTPWTRISVQPPERPDTIVMVEQWDSLPHLEQHLFAPLRDHAEGGLGYAVDRPDPARGADE